MSTVVQKNPEHFLSSLRQFTVHTLPIDVIMKYLYLFMPWRHTFVSHAGSECHRTH